MYATDPMSADKIFQNYIGSASAAAELYYIVNPDMRSRRYDLLRHGGNRWDAEEDAAKRESSEIKS